MTMDPHTPMCQYYRNLHSAPYLLRAFRPWESAEPVCQLFLLATQMYFFYLVVNRVDVCISNSSKTYKLHPGHWCSFLRGDIALAGQTESETTMGGRTPEHPTPLARETGNGDGEKEEEAKRWVSFAPSSTG